MSLSAPQRAQLPSRAYLLPNCIAESVSRVAYQIVLVGKLDERRNPVTLCSTLLTSSGVRRITPKCYAKRKRMSTGFIGLVSTVVDRSVIYTQYRKTLISAPGVAVKWPRKSGARYVFAPRPGQCRKCTYTDARRGFAQTPVAALVRVWRVRS